MVTYSAPSTSRTILCYNCALRTPSFLFFPSSCLHNLTRPACPLCRHAFNPNLTVKLHIELDTTRPSPTTAPLSTTSVSAEQEARRLHEAIAGIAETGSTESNLRQLIEDGKAFLRQQPRSLVSGNPLIGVDNRSPPCSTETCERHTK